MKSNGRFDYPYFRALWNRVVIVLLAASFLPVILVGGVCYYFTVKALKDEEVKSLEIRALQSKASIDNFLAREVVRLQQVAACFPFSGQGPLDSQHLKAVLDSLNGNGRHYVRLSILGENTGPLASTGTIVPMRNPQIETETFNRSMAKGFAVSELFRGADDKVSFLISVSGASEGNWGLLACIDGSVLAHLPPGSKEQHGKSFLVSRDINFQIDAGESSPTSPLPGEMMEVFSGTRMQETTEMLLLKVYQDWAPWMNVLQIARDDAFHAVRQVRITAVYALIILGIPVIGIILLIGNDLVSRLESKRGAIKTLDRQLRRTSYLSSSMELSLGCFREVKDTNFNIDSAIAVLREEPVVNDSVHLRESIDQIHSEVQRGRIAVERFLRYIQPQPPLIGDTDVHRLLDDLLGILDRELRFRNIEVRRSFQEGLPTLRTDPSKLRQVFQNVVLNAIEAVESDGRVSLVTSLRETAIAVEVTDTGPGIPEANFDKIFEPLWTTRLQGTGLGLPICRDILDRLGGEITVWSEQGKGTSVTIILPLRFAPGTAAS